MDEDGLIEHGSQLTWMDATVDGYFITPRKGKAVEIQALFYNALKIMELQAKGTNQKKVKIYSSMAKKAKCSFINKIWNQQEDYLFDIVARDGKDPSQRPNQLIALSFDFL